MKRCMRSLCNVRISSTLGKPTVAQIAMSTAGLTFRKTYKLLAGRSSREHIDNHRTIKSNTSTAKTKPTNQKPKPKTLA